MAIRQRHHGWQVDVGWKGQRERVQVADRKMAIACEADLLAAMKLGKPTEPIVAEYTGRLLAVDDSMDRMRAGGRIPVTLRQLLDRTHSRVWEGKKSADMLYATAKRAVDMLGPDMRITDLKSEDVDDMIEDLKAEGKSNATINRRLAGLSVMLKLARRRGWIDHDVHLPRLREPQGRIKWYTDEEQAAIVSLCDRLGYDMLGLLIIFLAETGLRVFSEATMLTTDDLLQAPNGRWMVLVRESKNGQSRTVPLSVKAHNAVASRLKDMTLISNYQSTNSHRLWPMERHQLVHQWRKVRSLMGWPEDSTHTLHTWRHTCCSRLIQRGAPLVQVKEWMGHKTIQTTMRYAHLTPESLDVLAGMLEDRDVERDVTPITRPRDVS